MILKSSFILGFWTLLSRITGFFRDSVMATYLGSGIVSDALVAASKLPNSFRRLLGEGAMSSVFVPIFSKKIAEKDQNGANNFANNIFAMLLFTLCIITIICQIFMPSIINAISPGFAQIPEKFNLTINLARINFIFLTTICLCALLGGVLNSLGKFAYFAAMPIILNLSIIIGIFAAKNHSEQIISYYISFATVISGFVQLFIMLFACKKNGVKISLKIPKKTDESKSFLHKMLHGLIGSGIYQINIFVDTIFASMFAGGVSYLYYTDRINQLPLTLIGGTLGVALLPIASKYIKLKNYEKINQIQQDSIKFAFFASIIIISTLHTFGSFIVDLIYVRGEFTNKDAEIVTKMLQIFSYGFFFSTLSKINNAFLFAAGDTKSPMKTGFFATILNVVINFCLYKKCGVFCVVYATLISSIISGIIPVLQLKKHGLLKPMPGALQDFLKIAILGIIMSFIQSKMIEFASGYTHKNILAIFLLFASCGIYLILALAFKIYSVKSILELVSKNGK